MGVYSSRSEGRLETADIRLYHLFMSVVTDFDNTILYGRRSPEEQFELFKRGRRLESGVWVVENPLEVVTYKDGFEKLSNHNYEPSQAVDAIPYPIDWGNTDRMYYFAGVVMERARQMGVPIRWGGDWDGDTETTDQRFVDLPHFELVI